MQKEQIEREVRQENISAPRLMMAELGPCATKSLLQKGGGRDGRYFFFSLRDAENESQAIIPAEMGGGEGLLMRHFVLFSISVVFFVSIQRHTLMLSGGGRDGRAPGTYLRRPPVEPRCIFMSTSSNRCLTFM